MWKLPGDHALAVAALNRELGDLQALGLTIGGDKQDLTPAGDQLHAYQRIAWPELDAVDPGCHQAHRPHIVLVEADGHTSSCGEEDLCLTIDKADPTQLIIFVYF